MQAVLKRDMGNAALVKSQHQQGPPKEQKPSLRYVSGGRTKQKIMMPA